MTAARSILFWFFLYFMVPQVLAGNIDAVLAPSVQHPTAGGLATFWIYFHNSSQEPLSYLPPPELDCRLTTSDMEIFDEKARLLSAQPLKSPRIIPPYGFVKAEYELHLPKALKNPVQLVITQIEHPDFYFTVRTAPTKRDQLLTLQPDITTDQKPLDALLQLYQPYARNISFYEPMYFLVGIDPENSKFQISLKYRLFNPEKPIAQKYPWLKGLHFAYTQTSFWDLASDSAPFEDTSYKPEIFYISDRIQIKKPQLDSFFLKAGLRHESNGKDNEDSRSTNTAYIEPIFVFYNEHRHTGLKIAPRIWTYFINENENNPDLERYRGYFSLGVTVGKADSTVVDADFWWAAEGMSVQIDATYPLHSLVFSDLDLYFQIQYTNRLAERLLSYHERTQAVRLGFAIVR